MYLYVESPDASNREAVCAMPDKPPKESSWIASTYFEVSIYISCDKRLIPLDISRFFKRKSQIAGGFVHSLIQISAMIEKNTI